MSLEAMPGGTGAQDEGVRSMNEQWVNLKAQGDGSPGLKLRRIRIELEQPTRGGESRGLHADYRLSKVADAATLVRLFRRRRIIEQAFFD
jgi:hypothetical protein